MIEIAQRCFSAIAERMLQKGINAHSLYKGSIKRQKVGADQAEVLSAEDFISGVRSLGIEELRAVEYACLIKVLSVNEEEKFIKLADLVLILDDYGIKDEDVEGAEAQPEPESEPQTQQQPADEEEEQPKPKPKQKQKTGSTAKGEEKKAPQTMDMSKLDEISMVLLLALTEYLIKANIPLYDLFGDTIYQQLVKTRTKQKNVEVINSRDFFEVLHRIGIQTEESEHENLKDFLCLDTHHKEKLSIKKLKKAIEEFAFNEELRKRAHQCYEALMAEEGASEGRETIKENMPEEEVE